MSASPDPDDDRTVAIKPITDASPDLDDDRTVAIKPITHDCANALPPGTRLGEFEVVRLVGEGGFGIVYLAHDEVLERRVALKEYLPSSLASRGSGLTVNATSTRHEETFQIGLRSFLNEARLLAQFDHPALVKVYRFWEAHGTAYMVMPYYEGLTLKQTLQRDGPPDEAQLKTLLTQLLDALEVLHSANCLHRDIAPDNIVMLASGKPVLLDFGAARRVISDRTQALTVILKPGYAPIEQYAEIEGVKQGPWTDVYALAGVAHYAITGAAPPPSIGRTLRDPMVWLEHAAAGRYSVPFLRAIDRALAVRPEDRPQSIAEFRALLGAEAVANAGAASTEARTIATPPPRKRLPAAAVIGGTLALTVALAGGIYIYGSRTSEPPAVAQTPVAVPAAGVRETPPPPQPVAEIKPAPSEAPAQTPPAQTKAVSVAPAKTSVATPPAEPTVTPPPAARPASRPPPVKPARTEPREQPPSNAVALAPSSAPEPAPAPAASNQNQLAAIASAALEDGEKCLRARQYDCAIANANSAMRVEPANARAKRLKTEAEEAQRRALSQIKIE